MILKINSDFQKSVKIIKQQKSAKYDASTKTWTVEPNSGAIEHGRLGVYIKSGDIEEIK